MIELAENPSNPEDMASSDSSYQQEIQQAELNMSEFESEAAEAGRILDTAEMAYCLNWRWADFQLYVISPVFAANIPPVVIPPEPLIDGSGIEFVYPIHDYGFKISTSKAEDMVSAGMSMCKLYYTIEKMIFLLIERLKANGVSTDTEVQVAFSGFIGAQRKGFESVINLNYNVAITNFDPSDWGDQYLETIKRLADKGYGYPEGAPREIYRLARNRASGPKT